MGPDINLGEETVTIRDRASNPLIGLVRAGLPQLAIPHLIDQFYWGQRVHELGVGTAPMARSKLESNKLASALEQVTGDNSIRAVALSLGELIRAEDGVANAVELIEAQFG
jgi:UDP:flavonoid glycosyltransferase YjiC (YdhE family)